jgi:hypothetical protein
MKDEMRGERGEIIDRQNEMRGVRGIDKIDIDM